MNTNDVNKISKAVVVNSKGKILLLLPSNKEKWHLPGGHLHQHETYLAGLKREVFEETNLQVTFFVLIDAKPGFQLWLCKCNQVPVKISKEHRSHKWMSFDDALTKLSLTKETARDIKLAQKKIERYANWFTVNVSDKKVMHKKKHQVDLQEE